MKDFIEGIFMKKLLLICILLVGLIFISGCIDEEKTNPKTSTDSHTSMDSQTSEPLIKPSDLPKGYYSSEYTTYAISQGESFEIRNFGIGSYSSSKNKYEGDVPIGKKRIATGFRLNNYDNNIQMSVSISELDSNSGLKEYISEMESAMLEKEKEYSTTMHPDLFTVETSSVGDYSLQYSYELYDEFSDEYKGDVGVFVFCSKNYLVGISTQPSEKETIRKETLKVAKAIESILD